MTSTGMTSAVAAIRGVVSDLHAELPPAVSWCGRRQRLGARARRGPHGIKPPASRTRPDC